MMSDENMKEPIECSGSCGINTPHWASFHTTNKTTSSEEEDIRMAQVEAAESIVVERLRAKGLLPPEEAVLNNPLDSLPNYPTEEEAEAVLQACGTSGKEVVNEFIERLLKENLELKRQLTTIRNAERTRVWEKAIEVAQISTKKSIAARLNVATAEILIRRLQAAANDEASTETDHFTQEL